MARLYSKNDIKFVRVIAEGGLVALHTHQIRPQHEQHVTMDFPRFDDTGKIDELLGSIQRIPDECANYNAMY